MASKSFYEVLEEQIRTDLRTEIRNEVEAEVRAEFARKTQTSSSEDTPRAWTAGAAVGRLESWLASNVGKTFFSARDQARRSYGVKQEVHSSQASPSPGASQAHTPPATEPAETLYTPQKIEELCALELLRRYGASIESTFTETELKQAWRKAALRTHPDRFAQADAITQAQMGVIFREITEAYDLLARMMEGH